MKIQQIDFEMFKVALEGATNYLTKNKESVNALNVFPVPDGDTGTNMSLTIESALNQANKLDGTSLSQLVKAASRGSLMGARGNSGVILSQLFRGFADEVGEKETIDIRTIALGLKNAADTTYNAVMKPTEGTILTVARETAEYATRHYKEYTDIIEFLKNLIETAEKSLDNTPNLLPVLKESNVVDAGGMGFLLLLKGAYMALNGEEIVSDNSENNRESEESKEEIDPDNIKFAYCTEFIVKSDSIGQSDVDRLKSNLTHLGDSLLVVGDEGFIKTHLHTNNPGKALEYALELGSLEDIKIDNMKVQYSNIHGENSQPAESKEYSFIAVAVGDGLSNVFKSINVDYVIPGGQTMNPSTEDFLAAIDKVGGENIYIIPNNSNIILAAEQAVKLSERKITVIPTTNIPQGISAILSFNESLTMEENKELMMEAIESIKSAQVTYSVKDTQMNGKDITKGDIIGVANKKILSAGKDINSVATDVIRELMDDNISYVTLYYGQDIKESAAQDLVEDLEETYDNVDFELVYGGQPLYYYILSLE